MRWTWPAALIFVAAIAVASLPASARKNAGVPTGLRGIDYGRPAPDFEFDSGTGAQRLSGLTGQVVVVHFWATWCKPCLEEMPLFVRLRAKYGAGVAVVTLPWREPVADARSHALEQGWTVPVAADVSNAAQKAYSISEVPTTVILRPDRSVSYVSVGEASWDELDQAMSKALAPPAPAASSIDPPPRL